MEQTRVSKYTEYRSSLLREGSEHYKVEKKPSRYTSTDSITTTLPMEDVMNKINDSEITFYKKKIKKRYITLTIVISSVVVAIAVIVVIAVLLWRK